MSHHDESDTDTPFGWNISKLCEAANHLRIAPEYTNYACEPDTFHDFISPLPLYQPEHQWYILFTTTHNPNLKPGLYRDIRMIHSQFTNGVPPGAECVLRYADTDEQAQNIWKKQCVRHHREYPGHEEAQEVLNGHAYSVASVAKAALVHAEILKAYPQFRPPKKRRRPAANFTAVDNGSITTPIVSSPSSSVSAIQPDRGVFSTPELEGWHLYVVHTHGQRRHGSLEYALFALHSHGTAPATMVLARSKESARGVFERETGVAADTQTKASP